MVPATIAVVALAILVVIVAIVIYHFAKKKRDAKVLASMRSASEFAMESISNHQSISLPRNENYSTNSYDQESYDSSYPIRQ